MGNEAFPSKTDKRVTDIDLIKVAKMAVFHKKVIAATTAICIAASVIFALLAKPQYESVSKLLPSKGNEASSGLSSMAAMFGVSLSTSSSPLDNLPQLLASPLFLDTLTKIQWRTMDTNVTRTLDEILQVEVETNSKAPHITAEMLKKEALSQILLKNISYAAYDNVKSLTVRACDPYLAHDINEFLLGYIDAYINTARQTNSRHQLTFIEERLEEYKQALSKSENNLNYFQKQNRVITDPGLLLQQQRLQREIKINENIVYELRKQLENARIDVEREIEVIEVFQRPTMPMWPVSPKRKLIAAGGMIAGLCLGLFLSVFICWWKENREGLIAAWKRPFICK